MMFVLTFTVLIGLVALMSVGVVFGGRRLRGSCGGVGADCACDAAGRPRECETNTSDAEPASAEPPLASLPAPGRHGHSQSLRSGALPESRG